MSFDRSKIKRFQCGDVNCKILKANADWLESTGAETLRLLVKLTDPRGLTKVETVNLFVSYDADSPYVSLFEAAEVSEEDDLVGFNGRVNVYRNKKGFINLQNFQKLMDAPDLPNTDQP
ncbi:hypothetical protein CT113_10705 [Levilactobacillus brevis]|uniref:hypothetical protein n=1 Tax=Levilactobacillus brevis TaxID=1580 RepID=UPI000466F5CB|nr:hypothetical protein [Levilactobacillus brevis]ARN93424.1 hypothetical protein AZI11_11240 [Levilactobacillus brevis]ATU70768.1 hypothetical protein CT113_10705 [Levilactobacillus brevis]